MIVTTIQLDKALVESLKTVREYPNQTDNDLIKSMIAVFQSEKKNKKNQYHKFLYKIQQTKMKELWDNNEDEGWDNV